MQYLDQYHVGGSQAVERLLVTLMPSPSDIVLDIGSGLGGPARQVATASGCRVTGVDITEAYVKAAAELTDRCGLSDRVRFVHRDIADLVPEQPFDAGFTMHVQMNIEAKQQWFAEIAQRLAPRARFAVWEVCRTSDAELSWPLPWSMDGSDSHLATSDNLRDAILGAGFELRRMGRRVRLGQLLVRHNVRRWPSLGSHPADAPGGRFRPGAQLRRSARRRHPGSAARCIRPIGQLMHSSGFDDVATESLTIEGTADGGCGTVPRVATIRRRTADGPLAGGMTILGLFVATFLPPSRPRKSEDALQQTELLSVGTVCADVPVPMDKEISGH